MDAAGRAEVALAVAPGFEGRGIGTRVLEVLAEQARAEGIVAFDAWVPRDDRRVIDLFASSGFDVGQHDDRRPDVLRVSLGLGNTPAFLDRSAARAREAASASMRPFFGPVGVAVIGANRERGRIGSEVFHNLIGRHQTAGVSRSSRRRRNRGTSRLRERRRHSGSCRSRRDCGARGPRP